MIDIKAALDAVDELDCLFDEGSVLQDKLDGIRQTVRTTLESLSAPVEGEVAKGIEQVAKVLHFADRGRVFPNSIVADGHAGFVLLEAHIARLTEERDEREALLQNLRPALDYLQDHASECGLRWGESKTKWIAENLPRIMDDLTAERTAHEQTKAELAEINGKFLNSQASLICANSSLNGLRYVVQLSQAGHQTERERREQAERRMYSPIRFYEQDGTERWIHWEDESADGLGMVAHADANFLSDEFEQTRAERDRLAEQMAHAQQCPPGKGACGVIYSDDCKICWLAWAREEE